MLDIQTAITLEIARLQREAFSNVRKRAAEQQLGEAWVGLEDSPEAHPSIPEGNSASSKKAA